MNRSTLFLIFIFSLGFSYGQSFDGSSKEKFLKSFKKVVGDIRPKETKELADKLEPVLLSDKFKGNIFSKMVITLNLMESKRMKPYPEMFNYVEAIYGLVANDKADKNFNVWHNSLDQLLDSKNSKKAVDLLETSSSMFNRNVLFESNKLIWGFRGGDYTFEYDKKPYIKFKNTTLYCHIINKTPTKEDFPVLDSTRIENTSGTYEPLNIKWEGTGGIVRWEQAGDDSTYAEITHYQFSMRNALFTSDSTVIHTPYFNRPLTGTFKEDCRKTAIDKKRIYPQFISYDGNLKINDVMEDVNYEGGFAMRGASFVGSGNTNNLAKLIFMYKGRPFIIAEALEYELANDLIVSENSKITINLKDGYKITHPGVNFRYDKGSMTMMRGNSGVQQTPFTNTYHKLDMYVDQIEWHKYGIDIVKKNYSKKKKERTTDTLRTGAYKDSLLFSVPMKSRDQRMVYFESHDFFDNQLWDKMQGMGNNNPIGSLYNYYYKHDKETFTEGEAFTAIGYTESQAKPILLEMSNMGFIEYDLNNKLVHIKKKLENFVKAKSGKKDYDEIQIVSNLTEKNTQFTEEEKKANPYLRELQSRDSIQDVIRGYMTNYATIDLLNLNLDINGVDRVGLSRVQTTFILPDEYKIQVQQNRNMKYDGWLFSGKWEVHMKDGGYDYGKNTIFFQDSDAAKLRVAPQRPEDGTKSIRTVTTISGMSGFIELDDTLNRSGFKKDRRDSQGKVEKPYYSLYPKLTVTKKSKVYYDDPSIYRGAYERDRFYFTLEPFKFDSLDNFRESNLKLEGTLTSAGIFPDFKEELVIMPDYSLGFMTKSPPGGYDFYGQGTKYDNLIVLSGNGLQGKGEINFIESNSKSNKWAFLPDSTMGIAQFVNNPVEGKSVEFPDITGDGALVIYQPKDKLLKAKSYKNPLVFFNGEATMDGTTYIRKEGATGRGYMFFKDATLASTKMKFKRWEIDADTADFSLADKEVENDLAFGSTNVNAHISFKDRKGEFKSNNGEEVVEFPANKYICKMDMFTWFMDVEEIELSKSKDVGDVAIETNLDLAGSNFYSVHKDQDSLNFMAPKAKFSIKKKTILCKEVSFIDVADARIFPDSNLVVIRKNAIMDPLNNSKITVNRVTKFHEIYEANTNITARMKYESQGKYNYYDADSNISVLNLYNIHPDSTFQTRATGIVKAEEKFRLSPEFEFYGNVNLVASSQYLEFDGATKVNHNCTAFAKSWMKFKTFIDPKSVSIPVTEEMKDLDGNPISAGIVFHNSSDQDSMKLYPTFLSALESGSDHIVITSNGVLNYSREDEEFKIATIERIENPEADGNYISLHSKSCLMTGIGKIDLGIEVPGFEFDSYGKIEFNQATKKTSLSVSGPLVFGFDQASMEKAAEGINKIEDLEELPFDVLTLGQSVRSLYGAEAADKLKTDLETKPDKSKITLPKDMKKNAVYLSNVKMEWNPENSAFQTSELGKIGVTNFYGTNLFYNVPGQLLLKKSPLIGKGELGKQEIVALKLQFLMKGYVFFANLKKKSEGGLMFGTSDKELHNELLEKVDKIKADKLKIELVPYSKADGTFLNYFDIE
ncbi:MAG: hypothetical protein KDC84_11500 [Crocinitomicaceae bacterium]|nr:hypothetical protein [Crocinitomicaceae bacterium]